MIDAYEHLDLNELQHRMGEMQVNDLVSTQNALIILCRLMREQAQEIKILKAEVEHLGNVVQDKQERPR